MNPPVHPLAITRRHFFSRSASGLGGIALGSLLSRAGLAATPTPQAPPQALLDSLPHIAPKARRIIWLFMSGGPAQIDLWDHKPLLREKNGQNLPDEIRRGQRLTGMSGNQSALPLAGSHYDFHPAGSNGTPVSSLLPHTARIVDDLCIIHSMWTEAINHDPAITYLQTGSQNAGRPSFGSWLSYGLGSLNENLPSFIVLLTRKPTDQPLYARLWGSGFLNSIHQGVRFSSGSDPVFFLSNPDGICGSGRRAMLDKLNALNRRQFEKELDPEIESRIDQYEMAFRMQTSVPETTDLSAEPDSTFELYGPDARQPGTFAANCLLARRLAERGTRFIQLYHPGWDNHDNLPRALPTLTRETDQACAALVTDLKQRGMLDDTLVVWGGEFGRTSYCQGRLTKEIYGRDHHPRCFTLWLAGAGVRAGTTYGRTDDYGYNILGPDGAPIDPSKHKRTPGAVHVHDLHATLLHLLGIDHLRLGFRHQGRDFRLTDVHGHIIPELLA